MKKVIKNLFLVILAVVSIALVGCRDNGKKLRDCVEEIGDNSIFMSYSYFDGTKEYLHDFEDGDVITVEVVSQTGAVYIVIQDTDGEDIYCGNLKNDMTFTVTVHKTSEYNIKVEAKNHTGSYSITW